MTKSSEKAGWLSLLGSIAVAMCLAMSGTAFAQSTEEKEEEEDATPKAVDEITVTGSRLKRDTFSSVAPLQIISAQVQREVGLIDPASILQESSSATGQQIDLTFQGFVLDNGPGASTVSLRGLGSARTLLLIDGRRVSPGGVEGAPVSPDLNLIPRSLVNQYDILLDGASSVYGSDAVAGVTNVILRKDFDGLEVELFNNSPEQSGGVENTVSAVYGLNNDRGFFGIGAEMYMNDGATVAQRKWTAKCDRHVEVTTTGEFRTVGLADQFDLGQRAGECKRSGLAGRFITDPFGPAGGYGSIYYTPGFSNSGVPNFSESSLFGIGVDGDGNADTDIDFIDYSINPVETERHIYPDVKSYSFMSYGEYTLSGEANITPFYEVLYAKREFFSDSGAFQLFPFVPASNPFNPCNPAAAGGVDCGDAWDSLMTNPNFVQQVVDAFGGTPTQFGLLSGPAGPIRVRPVVSVDGDRTNTEAEVDQTRVVAGLKGDIPMLNFGDFTDWTFETAVVWSQSTGVASRKGIRDDRLMYSVGYDPNTGAELAGGPCDPAIAGTLDSAVSTGCVPVNLFAPSLYRGVVGNFATAAERNYLFDSRDFDTEYEQSIFTAFATGSLFNLPAGNVAGGIGIEYRHDEIHSIPDDIAADGLFFGFFADGGAEGEKDTKEFFLETEFPILANAKFAKELDLNLSARWTDDEFYGDAWTYSAKAGWRPVDSLLIRGTYGTSYRAPNLRENFLRAQTGFNTLSDPCVIPDAARNPLTGGYDPTMDTRDATVLANCVANGVDPTMLDNNGFTSYSVEVAEGGATTLDEETSDSYSFGFAFDQPFFEEFDMTMSVTYYEIDIDDSIIEPSAQFIINDCYFNDTGTQSAFCSRIRRDSTSFIDFVDQSFINRDNETSRGLDINIAYDQQLTMFDRGFDLSLDLVLNHTIEASQTINEGNIPDYDDAAGEFGFPSWRGNINARLDWSDYRVTWATRYIGDVEQDPAGIDAFSNVPGNADTCLGTALGDVDCRDVGFADDYMTHSASFYYYGDSWTLGGGIRNVFDKAPPLVDGSEVLAVNNVPIGVGYDLNGRVFFVNVKYIF